MVMDWLIFFVAVSLTMTALTTAALRQSIKKSEFMLAALITRERLVSIFVVSTFTVASIYGLSLLAAKVLL
jgi:hypothetical protein